MAGFSSLKFQNIMRSSETCNELILDWPSVRPKRVTFSLENNSVRSVSKSRQERRETWHSRADQEKFKRDALRDAQFFRALRNSNERIDPSVYEDKVCAWGLEKAIFKTEAFEMIKNKKLLVKSVVSIYGLRDIHPNLSSIENEAAATSRELSASSNEQAHKIALLHEKSTKKLR
mmetsp:Transcript_24770/g.51422  ORF Transcript_24770/g.51422 Transcript_24770/m.51422 type:complete len:175 (-) Transcript_24770:64-588(-)